MIIETFTLTEDQRNELKVAVELAIAIPGHGIGVGTLRSIVPDLSASGLGVARDDQHFTSPALCSADFAQQVARARKWLSGEAKCGDLERNVWAIAHRISIDAGKPICAGALVLGALIEGFAVSRDPLGPGCSRLLPLRQS